MARFIHTFHWPVSEQKTEENNRSQVRHCATGTIGLQFGETVVAVDSKWSEVPGAVHGRRHAAVRCMHRRYDRANKFIVTVIRRRRVRAREINHSQTGADLYSFPAVAAAADAGGGHN